MAYYLFAYFESKFGRWTARKNQRSFLAQDITIKKGIAAIQKRWPNLENEEDERPIFILSAGWRSGSTLIQRLIMSKERILIWGEPIIETVN